jgi:hypothetical protein
VRQVTPVGVVLELEHEIVDEVSTHEAAEVGEGVGRAPGWEAAVRPPSASG